VGRSRRLPRRPPCRRSRRNSGAPARPGGPVPSGNAGTPLRPAAGRRGLPPHSTTPPGHRRNQPTPAPHARGITRPSAGARPSPRAGGPADRPQSRAARAPAPLRASRAAPCSGRSGASGERGAARATELRADATGPAPSPSRPLSPQARPRCLPPRQPARRDGRNRPRAPLRASRAVPCAGRSGASGKRAAARATELRADATGPAPSASRRLSPQARPRCLPTG
jgi:hypothetical protein